MWPSSPSCELLEQSVDIETEPKSSAWNPAACRAAWLWNAAHVGMPC